MYVEYLQIFKTLIDSKIFSMVYVCIKKYDFIYFGKGKVLYMEHNLYFVENK